MRREKNPKNTKKIESEAQAMMMIIIQGVKRKIRIKRKVAQQANIVQRKNLIGTINEKAQRGAHMKKSEIKNEEKKLLR